MLNRSSCEGPSGHLSSEKLVALLDTNVLLALTLDLLQGQRNEMLRPLILLDKKSPGENIFVLVVFFAPLKSGLEGCTCPAGRSFPI